MSRFGCHCVFWNILSSLSRNLFHCLIIYVLSRWCCRRGVRTCNACGLTPTRYKSRQHVSGKIMDFTYLVFLYFGTIIFPTSLMVFLNLLDCLSTNSIRTRQTSHKNRMTNFSLLRPLEGPQQANEKIIITFYYCCLFTLKLGNWSWSIHKNSSKSNYLSVFTQE